MTTSGKCVHCGEDRLAHMHHRDVCNSDCRHCRNYTEVTVPKITRNMSTPESRAFWEGIEERAREVEKWPCWKRSLDGIGACENPGHCCKCDPLPGRLQLLCFNLALAGYCAQHAPPRPTTRFSMLEIDP